jgi:hypothetical protein
VLWNHLIVSNFTRIPIFKIESKKSLTADCSPYFCFLPLNREPFSFTFPRRVLIPWLAGAYICDYLQQSETPEVLTFFHSHNAINAAFVLGLLELHLDIFGSHIIFAAGCNGAMQGSHIA